MSTVNYQTYDTVSLTNASYSGSYTFNIDNPTLVTESDYSGNTIRTTVNTWDYIGSHIWDRLASKTVSGGGVSSAKSYGYDGSGNVTGVTESGTNAPTLATTYTPNSYGQITQVKDPKGNITKYGYTRAWFDSDCPVTSATANGPSLITDALNHQTTVKYYTCSGRVANVTDFNLQKTSYTYDGLNRTLNITYPDSGSTSYTYTDTAPNSFITTRSISTPGIPAPYQMEILYDGLGRALQSQLLSDPVATVYTDTVYDALGRVASKSNPYRSTSDVTYGITKYFYDALDRVTVQMNTDSSVTQSCFNGLSTGQSSISGVASNCRSHIATAKGEWVDGADENGSDWQRTSDALGRMTSVLEPNGTSKVPSMETDYAYDVLGNLLGASQNGVSGTDTARTARSFTYDGLSRLLSAVNPESGTVNYTYDDNGNLIQKVSPSVNATSGTQALGYCFDALNRVTAKLSVAPTSTICASPAASQLVAAYSYDAFSISGASKVKGRLTDEKSYSGGVMVAERSPYVYDPMGRVTKELQCTPVNCSGTKYAPAYTYDLTGNVITAAAGLPSSIGAPVNSMTFTYGYDAVIRLGSVTSNVPSSTKYPGTLFQASSTDPSSPSYGAMGLINASYGVNASANTSALSLVRSYDRRGRVLSETDTAQGEVTPATGSVGSITITGSEQSVQATPAYATATITMAGTTTSPILVVNSGTSSAQTISLAAGASIQCTVGPSFTTATIALGGFPQPTLRQIAQHIASALSASGSPVTAVVDSFSINGIVTIASQAIGSVGNYALDIRDLTAGKTYGNSMYGGQDSTLYNGGVLAVLINGYSGQVVVGQGATALSVATDLQVSLRASASAAVLPPTLTVLNSQSVRINLSSATVGSSANGPIDVNNSYDSLYFTGPSFAVTTSGMSGGTDASTSQKVAYSYSISASGGYDGAGNVKSVADSVIGTWGYTYDTLNRLITAKPSSGGYSGQYGCWSYDGFGDRTAESYQTTACPSSPSSLTATATYGPDNRVTWTSVNAAGNDFTYDGAGNVLNDNLNAYLYDIEGRLCAVKNLVLNTMTGYVYGADGARVAKGTITSWSCNLATNGFSQTSSYVLGLGGEEVSELKVSGSASTWVHTNVFAGGKLLATYHDSDTYFPLSDWQGTKRAGYTPDGLISTFFSLPYGNGLSSSGNAPDATEHHFTGKERDSESGNDYFGARYYASSMGRFMSPDWIAKEEGDDPVPYAKLDNPQTLNLYTYGLNNPLSETDPDGHMSTDTYVPDLDKHGGAHIDRYNKNGQNVGRYRTDGTPMKFKGKLPAPVPNADKGKFEEAKKVIEKKQEDRQQYQNDVKNKPVVPAPPLPDELKPCIFPRCYKLPDSLKPIPPFPGPDPNPFPLPFPFPLPRPVPFPIPEPIPVVANQSAQP